MKESYPGIRLTNAVDCKVQNLSYPVIAPQALAQIITLTCLSSYGEVVCRLLGRNRSNILRRSGLLLVVAIVIPREAFRQTRVPSVMF